MPSGCLQVGVLVWFVLLGPLGHEYWDEFWECVPNTHGPKGVALLG